MKSNNLLRRLNKLYGMKNHIDMIGNDPLLMEAYQEELFQLKLNYGTFLEDLLFEIYDDVCEDSNMHEIEDYISGTGVKVEADDFPGVEAYLKLRFDPVRFELESPDHSIHEVVKKVLIEAA